MGGLRILLTLVCVAGLGRAQIQFPGASEESATPSPTQASPPSASSSTPNTPNTRFLPGLEGLDFLGLFDPCQRCSFNDQQLANQCCQTGKRNCCAFLQPVGPISPFGPVGPQFQGQFPGQFSGGFPGQFPGVVGPPGIPGQVGGGKPGICPFAAGGFNRFASSTGASCVQECQSDFQCPGIQKCCPIGCSSACRSPPGAEGGFSQPSTLKPGFCPRPGLLGGLFGLRSGATGAPGSTRTGADAPQLDTLEGDVAATGPETNEARELRREERKQQRREERLAQRQEGGRTRRSPQQDSQDNLRDKSPQREIKDDQRERRLNRLGRVFDRVTRNTPEDIFVRNKRSPQQSQDDFRERRLNRFERVFDRVTRDTPEDASRFRRSPQRETQDDFRERRLNRFERVFDRTVRDASEDDSRVRRSPQRDSRDDRRERRRNRFERVFGRVTRDASDEDDSSRVRRSPQRDSRDDRRERRRNRFERVFGRVTREASEHEVSHSRVSRQAPRDEPADPQQNTRFFLPKLPNIFCRDECFNDFDCPGNLKCCSKDDCRSCVNPSFF